MATSLAETVFGEIVGETGYVQQILMEKMDKYQLEELVGLLEDEIYRINTNEKEELINKEIQEEYDPSRENVSAITDNILI